MLEHLDELVVKAVGESGGYGMLMGPWRDQAPRSTEFRERDPGRSRATTSRSRWSRCRACPSYDPPNGRLVGRHVDLRPYCLYDGEKVTIVPGGLTRVALQPESLVVNSSQGGGSKDTWVLRGDT